jgi:hypothetical protein
MDAAAHITVECSKSKRLINVLATPVGRFRMIAAVTAVSCVLSDLTSDILGQSCCSIDSD